MRQATRQKIDRQLFKLNCRALSKVEGRVGWTMNPVRTNEFCRECLSQLGSDEGIAQKFIGLAVLASPTTTRGTSRHALCLANWLPWRLRGTSHAALATIDLRVCAAIPTALVVAFVFAMHIIHIACSS